MGRKKMNLLKWVRGIPIFLCLLIGVPDLVNAVEVGSGGIQITHQSPIAQEGGSLDFTLRLPGVVANDDQIIVTVHEPVINETGFLQSVNGQGLGGVLASRTIDVSDLDLDAWGLAAIKFPLTNSGDEAIRVARVGVYPITIEMRTASQELVGRVVTHLIRIGDAPSQRLALALVAKIPHTTGHSDSKENFNTPSAWFDLLVQHFDIPVSVTFQPNQIDHSVDETTAEKFHTTKTQHELVRGSFIPIDEAALMDAGLSGEVSTLLKIGSEKLRTLGTLAPPTLWVGHGMADTAQVDRRWQRGIREIIVEPSSLFPLPATAPRGPVEILGVDSNVRALVVDHLSSRKEYDTAASEAHRVLTHLAVIAFTQQPTPLLVLDLGAGTRDVDFATAFLKGLTYLDWVEPVSASAAITKSLLLKDGKLQQYRLRSHPSSTTENFTGYRDAQRYLTSFRSMIRDEDASEHDQLSQKLLFSLSSDSSKLDRETLWESIVSRIRVQTSLIDIPPDESIQLTSQKASVPFSFQNRADIPLRVELRIIGEKLTVEDFDDGESTTLVLEPGVTTHRFQLRALGSGSFPVTIELHSPDGGLLVGKAQAAIRATTPTGVGLGLTIGAAVFLLVWWVVDTKRKKAPHQ
jgi:hypothetical protein